MASLADGSLPAAAPASVESAPSLPDPSDQPTPLDCPEASPANVELPLDGFTLDEGTLANSPLLPYLAMIASVIEGRRIRVDELLRLLLRSMRQRSFDRLPWREYVLRFLDRHPP